MFVPPSSGNRLGTSVETFSRLLFGRTTTSRIDSKTKNFLNAGFDVDLVTSPAFEDTPRAFPRTAHGIRENSVDGGRNSHEFHYTHRQNALNGLLAVNCWVGRPSPAVRRGLPDGQGRLSYPPLQLQWTTKSQSAVADSADSNEKLGKKGKIRSAVGHRIVAARPIQKNGARGEGIGGQLPGDIRCDPVWPVWSGSWSWVG